MINKRLAALSLSASLLISYSAYNQDNLEYTSGENYTYAEYARDSSSLPTDSTAKKKVKLKTIKNNKFPRFKDLEKEKERRKKIREKYQKNKASND